MFKDALHRSDLSASSPTSADASEDGNQPGSRENPLPIGETVNNQDWDVTPGAPREAWAEIAAEN
jgi:hypothetical protein